MLNRIAADGVLLVHLCIVVFAVFGGALLLIDVSWLWIHVPVVLWSSLVNLMSWTCPLTPIEKALRRRAGQTDYSGGCVQHYAGRAVYPGGMPRRFELIAGVSVIVWNVFVYGVIFLFVVR